MSAAVQPAPTQPMMLPIWTIGYASGTIFRDGNPSGVEVKVFNGRAHEQLVAQANVAAQLLAVLQTAYNDAINHGTAFPYGPAYLAMSNASKGAALKGGAL